MAEHHPLGAAGGAAGVEDAREVGTAAHRIRNRLALRQQGFVAFHSGRHVAVIGIHQLQSGRGLRQACSCRCECLVDHQHQGAAIAQGVLVFERAPPDVERNDHRAGPCGRQIKFEVSVGIEREHRDAFAGSRPEPTQAARQPRYSFSDLAPVPSPVAKHGGEAIGIDLQRAPQSLRSIHRAPPRRLLFAGGEAPVFADRDFAGGVASPSVSRSVNSSAMAAGDIAPSG